MRVLSAVVCLVLLAGCAGTGAERQPDAGGVAGAPDACLYSDPFQLLGMPPGSAGFRFSEAGQSYLDRRCGALRSVARSLLALRMRGHPVGIWRAPSAPLAAAVRVTLDGLPSGGGAAEPALLEDLRRIAQDGYAATAHPLVVLGERRMAGLVAGHLRDAGVTQSRIYINTGAIAGFERAVGPRGPGADRQVVILELRGAEAFTRYAGHPPAPGHRPDGLPSRQRLADLQDDRSGAAAAAPRALQSPAMADGQGLPEQADRSVEDGPAASETDEAGPARSSDETEVARPAPRPGERPRPASRDWGAAPRSAALDPLRAAPLGRELGGRPVADVEARFAEMIGWEDPQRYLVFREARAAGPPPALSHACIAEPLADPGYREQLVRAVRDRDDVTDYQRGLYQTAWLARLGPHSVGLGRVGVRAGGDPDTAANLQIYWDHGPGFDPGAQPDVNVWAAADAYVGAERVLYRVYPGPEGWPVRCIDLVFTRDTPTEVFYGRLYYDDGQVREATFTPRRVRGSTP